MRLLLEKHNDHWTLEFACFNKCTSNTWSTRRPGAQGPPTSLAVTAALFDRLEPRLDYYPPDLIPVEGQSQHLSHDHYKPSPSRSLYQRITGKIFRSISRKQKKDLYSAKGQMSQNMYPAELQAMPAELPGDTTIAWELDGRAIQQEYPRRHVNHTNQSASSIRPFGSLSRSPDVSPIQEHGRNHCLPLDTDVAAFSKTQRNTLASISTSTSTTPIVSPLSPDPLDSQNTLWRNNVSQHHRDFFSPPNAFASQSHSPETRCEQYKTASYHYFNHNPISPVSTRRSSLAQGYREPSTTYPTPPVGSPMNHGMAYGQYQNFESHGRNTSSPPSKPSFGIASPGSPPIVNGALPNINATTRAYNSVQHPSYWMRDRPMMPQMPQIQRVFGSEQIMTAMQDDDIDFPSNNMDEPLPSYSPRAPDLLPPLELSDLHQKDELPPTTLLGKKSKRKSSADSQSKPLNPICCGICGKAFKGEYQIGNLKRHTNSFHATRNGANLKCRVCGKEYRRGDARRKHEWKKHSLPDTRPEKRRPEKKQKEKRIYMPEAPDAYTPTSQHSLFECASYPQSIGADASYSTL